MMTPKERAAMQQALELLWERGPLFSAAEDKAITALREALAVSEQRMQKQAEQEPVAWIKLNEDGVYIEDVTGFPVYAAPVQQVDLTDDEIWATYDAYSSYLEFARAVIQEYRSKNGII